MPESRASASAHRNDEPRERRTYRGAPLEERRRDQRDRLIAAGRDVFAAHGYANASIEDIVAHAHVSRTSFYRFFAGKEECLLAVFHEGTGRVLAALGDVAGSELPPAKKVPAGVEALVRALAADPAMARVILIEVVGATRKVEAARAQARAGFADLLHAQLRATGLWRGRPRSESELVAIATMAAIAESVSHLVATGRLDEWASLVKPLGRYALRALTPGDSLEAGA